MYPRNNVLLSTTQGTLIVNRNDSGVGWQLATFGAYDPPEVDLLRQLALACGAGAVVMDIGANLGVHSVVIGEALRATGGRVLSFEAQRIVFYMLAGNVAIASLENVFPHHNAVGAQKGRLAIPTFDYSRPLSFGSVEFGGEQKEFIGQQRIADPARQEFVDVITVDSLALPRVDLMKIDVEGMEMDVLDGAAQTIESRQPILFLEYLKGDPIALAERLWRWNYALYGVAKNFLGIPARLATHLQLNGLDSITRANIHELKGA
ncbi:MAG: FkbM family methyltransferase [Nevskia sp.]|nr:FkbM family methyltransferase [Nevskia sp.]